MCGRASLTKTEKELEERFQAAFYTEDLERYRPLPSFNIAPTHFHPILSSEDTDHFKYMKWGLIPSWAKDAKIGPKMINARVETLLEKPMFKSALQYRRCLVPIDGFYEWKIISNKDKKPFRIVVQNGEVYSLAGIYDTWKDHNGQVIYSFSIITLESNTMMKELHDRMPAILHQSEEKQWIDLDMNIETAMSMIKPYPSELMSAYPVSSKVNSVANNDEELIKIQKPENTLF
ncbi:MAG TPA: SOS response-associated peptidase [Saprospiraceae bacterium]|jgi:putative SOS response-associated peptidase YedK|nr:SOS response-associated peptidase [Saprospiraceae bacterium]HUN17853.1 SOS response-associated peptidase [Saprospiraceae bacterium]